MDAHQPAEPGVPIWYVGHHLPTPKNPINGHTLETEAATGVSSAPYSILHFDLY